MSVVTPEIQEKFDGIRQVVAMPNSVLYDEISRIGELIQNGTGDDLELKERMADLETFGNLKDKSYEQLYTTLENLQALEKTGKTIHQRQIEAEKQQREEYRIKTIEGIAGGDYLMGSSAERKAELNRQQHHVREGLKNFWRHNLSFEWLLK